MPTGLAILTRAVVREKGSEDSKNTQHHEKMHGLLSRIADLKELEGLELGCQKPIAMMDGYNFNGAKAYKDTKLALMMTSNMLHDRA